MGVCVLCVTLRFALILCCLASCCRVGRLKYFSSTSFSR